MTKEDFNTRFSGAVPNSNTGVIWGRDEKATFRIPAHFRHLQLVTLQRCLQISWDAPYFNKFVGGRRSYKLSVRTKFDARDSFTMRCNWYFFFNVKFIATFGQFIVFIHGNQKHHQPPFCFSHPTLQGTNQFCRMISRLGPRKQNGRRSDQTSTKILYLKKSFATSGFSSNWFVSNIFMQSESWEKNSGFKMVRCVLLFLLLTLFVVYINKSFSNR